MKKILIIAVLAIFIYNSCGNDNGKKNITGDKDKPGDLSGQIIIEGSDVLYPLMNKWKQEFEKTQSGIKINVKVTKDDKASLRAGNGAIQLAMIARNLKENEKSAAYWAVPVAVDAVCPVVSFDNNYLQKIVQKGITKEKLAAVFSGKIKSWGVLMNEKSNEPIEVYKVQDSTGTSDTWADFINVKPANILGISLYTEKDVPMTVAPNKNAIAYCSMTNVFDIQTGMKKRNLYVVPVDLNSNGQADDNELVFDNLDDLKSAISSGKYSSPLVRKLKLVSKTMPADEATRSFIKWVLTIGQSYCAQYGFVNIEKKEAAEYLKHLTKK